MTVDFQVLLAQRIEALVTRIADLEKVCGNLNMQVADLKALYLEATGRTALPSRFGELHSVRDLKSH